MKLTVPKRVLVFCSVILELFTKLIESAIRKIDCLYTENTFSDKLSTEKYRSLLSRVLKIESIIILPRTPIFCPPPTRRHPYS